MRNPFKSKWKITQEFGVNKEYYSQFGLQGHEGIDLIPTGTVWDILCLEDGVVVKDEDNEMSGVYGNYLTVWHPNFKKAIQYCHLKTNQVSPGDQLKQGDVLGLMGKTGNTTGPHLHLNLFDVDDNGYRLNRDNGFAGGIDPLPWLEENNLDKDTVAVIKYVFEDLVRKSTIYDKIREAFSWGDNEAIILADIEKLKRLEDNLTQKEKQFNEASTKAKQLEQEIEELKKQAPVVVDTTEKLAEEIHENTQTVNSFKDSISDVSIKQTELIGLIKTPTFTGWKEIVYNFLLKH